MLNIVVGVNIHTYLVIQNFEIWNFLLCNILLINLIIYFNV